LTPADLPEPGYGQAFSTLFTAADYADAAARGQDEAIILQLTQDLRHAGWQGAHLNTLQLPSAANPDLHDRAIESLVSQCADEDSASRSMALLQTALIDREFEPAPLPTPIGNEAVLLRKHSTTSLGGPADQLRLLVRDEAFLLDLQITDWTNAAPPAEEAIDLIEVLQDRVREVVAGTTPGLSEAVFRLDPAGVTDIFGDAYRRRGGQQIPGYQQAPERVATVDARYRDLGVTDQYRYAVIWLEWARYQVDILHFTSDIEAAAHFRELADQELALVGVHQENVTEVTDLSLPGDDSLVVTFTIGAPEQFPESVYLAWIRVGDRVAQISLMAFDASAPQFQQLAQGQADCLQNGDCWEGTATLRVDS
jgi:hypothetical protein